LGEILDRALKQRLLGAVILTALLVILVPEWLDGAGHKARYPDRIEMPPIPEFKPMPAPQQPAAQPASAANDAAGQADSQAAEKVAAKPAEKVAEKPTVKPMVKPAAEPASSSAIHAWALQVGSFNDESNARVMRDRMRGEGYAAYILEQKSSGKMHYRVRIGPELDRDRVEKLKDEISRKQKINGMVVNHP